MRKVRARLRRATRVRSKIRGLTVFRLTVHRTPRHIYAQVVDKIGKVFAFASTVDLEVKEKINYAGNVKAAEVVGECVAKRALKAGVEVVAFDRSGFRYHGRVKALAESARKNGLKF